MSDRYIREEVLVEPVTNPRIIMSEIHVSTTSFNNFLASDKRKYDIVQYRTLYDSDFESDFDFGRSEQDSNHGRLVYLMDLVPIEDLVLYCSIVL